MKEKVPGGDRRPQGNRNSHLVGVGAGRTRGLQRIPSERWKGRELMFQADVAVPWAVALWERRHEK